MSERKLRAIIFGCLSFAVWLIYFKTQAPTVVFWDVGEFLATSYILGVPHPPGMPLYVILGKFLTLLPLPLAALYQLINGNPAQNAVLRITMISVLSGALTAGFVYLIILKVIELWKVKFPRHLTHLCAVFGALLGAFAYTVWYSSIEAETYTPSTLAVVLSVWLALNWWKYKDSPKGLRYPIFITYMLFLASGIHLTPLLIIPALFLFLLLIKRELILNWDFLGVIMAGFSLISMAKLTYEPTGGTTVLLILSLLVQMYYLRKRALLDFNNVIVMIFLLGGVLSIVGALAGNVFLLVPGTLLAVLALFLRGELYRKWHGLTLLLILIAVATEFYLMARAIHSPNINEADPRTWTAFWDVLLRRQYEPMNFMSRKIPVFGQLALYGTYFSWQFGRLLLPIVVLGLIGFFTHYANEKKSFALVGGVLILASLGLIFYLNLKYSPMDPNPAHQPREVRDRDYFFAISYTFFGLYAGIGLWEVLRLILVNLKNSRVARGLATVLGYVVAAAVIIAQLGTYWPQLDRSENYVAEDYAYNMLISPRPNAVMYTNGDNDTFPLWFDQEVLKVRTDVIIANLSLLNTNWYCKQLKDWGAPISFSYEDLELIPPGMRTARGDVIYLKDIMIRDMIATNAGYVAKDTIALPMGVKIPRIYVDSREKFKSEVIEGMEGEIPIYFAITVSPENIQGWQDYLLMEGLSFQIMGQRVGNEQMEGIDPVRTRYLLHADMDPEEFLETYKDGVYPGEVFRYRGVFNPSVHKDETHEKLIRNYASVALRLGYHFESTGNEELALQELKFGQLLLQQLSMERYRDMKRQMLAVAMRVANLERDLELYDDAIETMEDALRIDKHVLLYAEIGKVYETKATIAESTGNLDMASSYYEAAKQRYELAKSIDPKTPTPYMYLKDLYLAKGDSESARRILEEWITVNPNDPRSRAILEELNP
jgi:tetratricopeptide (TPR) repeat protein